MPARFTQRLKIDRMDELILAISMSNKKQTGDYLKEFVDLINRHNETDLKIKKVKVLLSCFLQRHYIGTEAAKQGGEIWKRENEAALMCLKNGAVYEISDWDEWVHHPHYEATLKEVTSLYETNDAFKTIIGNLVKRHAPKADEISAKNYLFEECTVFLLLKDAHVSYPSNELNAAVDFVTRYFKTDIHYHGYAFYSKAEAHLLPRKAVKPSSSTVVFSEEEKAIKEEVLKLASRLESIGIVGKSKQITFFKKVLPSTSQEVVTEVSQEEVKHANNLNLIKSSTLLASIFDILGLNYSVIDAQGDYLVQNNLSVSKISSGHMKAAEVDPITWEDCKNVMMKKERTVIEERFKERYYLSIKQPLYDNSHCLGILIVSHDISKEKQAEIAKQEFIMNMAHDLRTPFSGIVGLAQLQEMGTLKTPEDVKDYGKLIYESGNQLLEILNAVIVALDKNKINVIKDENVDIYKFSMEIQALIMPAIYLKKLNFVLDVDPAIGEIFTDKIRLKQIVTSLLSNAIKFKREGKIILSFEKTDQLKIKVSDTGIGIHKDHHKRIFEKFTKLKPSYESSTFTGCGIGLYLVRKLLNDLKGSITVESELGKGSTFQVEIPLPKRE